MKWLYVIPLLIIPAFCMAMEWALLKHPLELQPMKAEMVLMMRRGFIPVGIEFLTGSSPYRGAYVLYIKDGRITLTDYEFRWYDNPDEAASNISLRLEAGYIPSEISFDGSVMTVLYLKMRPLFTGWRLDDLPLRHADMEKLYKDNAADGFLPRGITSWNDQAWVLSLAGGNELAREYRMVSFELDDEAVKDGVDAVTAEGWTPWGLMVHEDSLTVLFFR